MKACMTERGEVYLPHFSGEEFTGEMSYEFITRLEAARVIAGVPFVVTSSYRTAEENERAGGVENSAHLNRPCNAVDIRGYDSHRTFRIVYGLLVTGFRRIILYREDLHIHVDSEPESSGKPQEVLVLK